MRYAGVRHYVIIDYGYIHGDMIRCRHTRDTLRGYAIRAPSLMMPVDAMARYDAML